jgi:hypothetical protein
LHSPFDASVALSSGAIYGSAMSFFLRLLAIVIFVGTALDVAFQVSATSWPKTEGKVVSGRWAMEDGMPKSERGKYVVEYEYTVAGTEYTGRRIGFTKAKSSVPIISAKDDRQPREGDVVMVWYAPFYKDYSLLLTEPNPSMVVWLVVAGLVSATLWIYARISQQPVM